MKTSTFLPVSLYLLLVPLQNEAQIGNSPAQFPEIKIYISKGQYNNLQVGKGQKLTLKNPVLLIDKDTAVVKEVHSRGNNSLTFEHKSLSIDLEKSISIGQKDEKIKIKKFDLLNLVMDKNLYHNRWAFLIMAGTSIFPLYNTFCTVWINDQPQGIYLLVEKPHYFTTTTVNSPYMIRRGINHMISDEYIDTPLKDESKKYKKQYLSLYEDIEKYKNEELYNQLKTKLQTDHYFSWLAFNYLIMNGDYADEVYLYILPKSGQFEVIPWDYDDILRPAPHEGMQARNAILPLRNKLIFSSEDPLDRAIGSNEFVYKQYLASFKNFLTVVSPEMLTKITDQVRSELESLSKNQEAVKASLFLGKESFQIEQAKEDMRLALDFVIKRRNALLKEME